MKLSLNKAHVLVEMCHFLINNLVYASKMLYLFEKFLVVKVAERVQELSRKGCPGCVAGRILDQLHLCQLVPLKERIAHFLPTASEEAHSNLSNLFHIFSTTMWIEDNDLYLEGGRQFISSITPSMLRDRRYINEDSVFEYPFNTSWLSSEEDFLASQVDQATQSPISQTLPPILPLEPTKILTPKKPKRKRKINVLVE